ncbi:uncharacterized protein EKO05_0006567 [Ascochyta rabiei]|uniref:Uncharacterized protein n=1 Tax=Didymella rabiei TaxID=5454 RepID=A0A162W0Z8_DIDRA|nr:uncharacterized protein EKO05_0006567 [Ascochyta rabiei]KZM18725.1 hypothetical protein ST47_g10074 [Ascochyta rabiei]UPX16150.1 hypothetical protein EKO05_0006567 [Ascochyta rabiei]
MPGRYSGAGRYNKLELKRLHEAMESHYYHDEGLSRDKAHKKAEETLLQRTGQSLSGPFGPGVLFQDSPECGSPRGYAEKHDRGRPVRETRFEREFYGSQPHDCRRDGDDDRHRASSHVLTPEQIKAETKAVVEEFLDKGASEDHARQQAEKFYIREAGKAYRAAAAGASRRPQPSRTSAFDFSGMGDILDDDEGYASRSSGPSRAHSPRGPRAGAPRPPGWEDARFDEYFTDEPRPPRGSSRGQSYYDNDNDEVPRSQTRQGFSSFSNGYEDDYDDEASYGVPRGYRTEERRPGGFSSPFGGCEGTYDENEPPRSSRGGPRGYRTEERRPGGFFSSSYFSHGPEEHSSGHSNRSHGPPPGSGYGRRYMEASGIKPAEDLYVTLGVSPSTSEASLKQAHRKLSIKHHPDREMGGAAAKKAATNRMAQINQAFDVLNDGKMREFYDRTGLIASKGLPP